MLMFDIALAFLGRTIRLFAVTVVLTPLVHTGHPGLQQSHTDAGGVGGGADRGACWGPDAGGGAVRGDVSSAGKLRGAAASAGAATASICRTLRPWVVTVELTPVVNSKVPGP